LIVKIIISMLKVNYKDERYSQVHRLSDSR